jgi:curved DNA-binding protein CbpA
MTYYDILCVPQSASTDEIKRAYRKLAQDFHPDKLAGIPPAVAKLAEEKFKDVQEAYEILTKHRAEYDNQLRAVGSAVPPHPKEHAHAAAPAPPRTSPQPFARSAAKIKKTLWYMLGKTGDELPWQTWVLLWAVLILCLIAALA